MCAEWYHGSLPATEGCIFIERKVVGTMNHYTIPNNFKDSGYIFNGQIAVRNAIDAIIMGLIGVLIAWLIPAEGPTKISVFILFAGLLGMAGLVGVKGVPLSTFLLDFVGWRKRRKKPFLYNDHGESFAMSSADIALESGSIRDMIADLLLGMKSKVASEGKRYVEGENFVFAADPELEALRFAEQEQQKENKQSSDVLDDQTMEPAQPSPAGKPSNKIDAESILDQITLN
jgi:hypothetical protein